MLVTVVRPLLKALRKEDIPAQGSRDGLQERGTPQEHPGLQPRTHEEQTKPGNGLRGLETQFPATRGVSGQGEQRRASSRLNP